MSKAAWKLDSDGLWHPFSTGELSWYRVWHSKIIQRIQFADKQEEYQFVPILDSFEPVSDIAATEGFREELVIRSDESGQAIVGLLGYPIQDEETKRLFDAALKYFDLRSEEKDGLLFSLIPLARFESSEIAIRQVAVLAAKLLYDALSRGENPRVAAEVFRRTMEGPPAFGLPDRPPSRLI